ncbi:hypothetical protein GC175_25440 [bacterium]|nr:hypothetical protein [bacterium]
MLTKRFVFLLLSLSLLLGACQPVIDMSTVPFAAPPANESSETIDPEPGLPDLGTLQVPFVPVLSSAIFFVAADMGYFAEQGLTVELQSVRNVDEMLAALSTGKLDATGMVVTTGFFNSMNQKLDFRLVSGLSDVNDVTTVPFLAVSKALVDSGEVKGVADLKGRKIAVNLRGSGLEYMLYKGLEQVGLTLDDVELVTIPGGEMLAAVENGAVDGVVAGILNVQRMVAQGAAVPLLNNTDVSPTGGDSGGLVFGQRLLQTENREVGIRFIMAILQAARFLNNSGWENPEVIAILQKYTGMEPAMIANSPVPVYSVTGELDEVGIIDMQSFQISRGYVEYAEPIPFEQMVEPSMLTEALSRLDAE